MSKIETITAERLDRLVDEGKEDVLQYFDLDNARRGSAGTKRINIDLPNDFLTQLDREATPPITDQGLALRSVAQLRTGSPKHRRSIWSPGRNSKLQDKSGI